MGGCLSFNGSTSKIDCGSDTTLDDLFSGGGTIVAWVYQETGGESNQGQIAEKGAAGSAGWFIRNNADGTSPYDYIFDATFSGTDGTWSETSYITQNTWTHVGFTYDSDSISNNPTYWRDGVNLGFTTETSTPSGSYDTDASLPFLIGNDFSSFRTFDGLICYMSVFTKILSEAEITQHMRRPGSVVDQRVGYWPLIDETNALDRSGNGNNGTPTSVTETFTGPPVTSM